MKLIWARLHGYKRFEEKATINLEGKVVAIVGPNETGKTSILTALNHIDSGEQFIIEGVSQDLTRDVNFPDNQVIVEAAFSLEDSDREALAHIDNGPNVRWLNIEKTANNQVLWALTPDPIRNLGPRKLAARTLEKMASTKYFSKLVEDKDNAGYVDNVGNVFQSEMETLDQFEIETIRDFITWLEAIIIEHHPLYIQRFPGELRELLVVEEAEDPSSEAFEILDDRRSRFLLFSNEDRALKPNYAIADAQTEFPPALENLARLAGLPLIRLRNAINKLDQGAIETLIQNANERLRSEFDRSWSQSGVSVWFSVNGRVLHISVQHHTDSERLEVTSIAERSDGLRHFVALIAFVSYKQEIKPILLIDEAEAHLHYDAQADVVQMFAKQEIVVKVIYTTHSIGCLPEDLGGGVRLVEATDDGVRSTVRNWFWTNEQPGFYPLLYGMGASMLAFIPLRYALFVEGPSDLILLPTLLREATNREYLGFQVVPGLSIASEERISLLEGEAPRTAYLLDSDRGGDEQLVKLLSAGVDKKRIFRLPSTCDEGLVIEDYLDPDIYCNVVNEEFLRWQQKNINLKPEDLPSFNRPRYIENICKSLGCESPSKRSLASNFLESRNGNQILYENRRELLKNLYRDITGVLGIRLG